MKSKSILTFALLLIFTDSIELAGSTKNFIGKSSDEFNFEMDGIELSEKVFSVTIDKYYGGRFFDIRGVR